MVGTQCEIIVVVSPLLRKLTLKKILSGHNLHIMRWKNVCVVVWIWNVASRHHVFAHLVSGGWCYFGSLWSFRSMEKVDWGLYLDWSLEIGGYTWTGAETVLFSASCSNEVKNFLYHSLWLQRLPESRPRGSGPNYHGLDLLKHWARINNSSLTYFSQIL